MDDEQPIIDMLVYNLEKEGYNTLEATDGEKAVDIALNNTPDLILLDIMIPKMDGLSVCKRIRHTLNVPIIMLSAKGEEIDKILGLELGADDYITKPFSIRELMARIKANLRKGKGSYEDGKLEANTNKIIVGDLQLDVDKFETRVKNKVIDLTLRTNDSNLLIEIQDYGCGMTNEVKDKLFKQMITTKGKKGTGLGLFMSYLSLIHI